MEGKSTFFIEMEETNNAMKLGSQHSLIIMVNWWLENRKKSLNLEIENNIVILKILFFLTQLIFQDELGRGTSTFDGVAIAYSILCYILENMKCRTLFATHYHMLLEEFRNHPNVAFYHMACHVIIRDQYYLLL